MKDAWREIGSSSPDFSCFPYAVHVISRGMDVNRGMKRVDLFLGLPWIVVR